MSIQEQIQKVLRSRKFWALMAGVLAAAGGYATGQVTLWQMLQAMIAALAVYSTGVALENVRKAG